MNTPRPSSLVLNSTRASTSYRPRRSLLVFAQALGVALSLPLADATLANPNGAQVIHGNVVITPAGNVLNINSSSPLSIINWQSFSIANGERVNINQQSAGDLSVNRVVGASRSMLDGTLWSNGRVVLINPNGITVGPNGMVDVAGFVASTLNQSDADILSGRRRFVSGSNSADIQILGTIKASSGDIYLLGRSVQNAGILEAKNGKAVLAAGEDLELVGSGLNNIRFNVQNTSNEVRNLGAIDAGAVGLFAGSLTHSGTIRATAISQDADGNVILQAAPGKATVDGQIAARGPNDKGGYVAVLGKEVHLQSNTLIDANGNNGGGEVLIGGDWLGQNPDIQQAEKTTMDAGAKITANALDNGDGGKVVLWSTGETKFKGVIEAKGGANGGNGGRVETSGNVLDFSQGLVSTASAKGRRGEWMLDPSIFCFTTNSTCISGGTAFNQTSLTSDTEFSILADKIVVDTGYTLDLNGRKFTVLTKNNSYADGIDVSGMTFTNSTTSQAELVLETGRSGGLRGDITMTSGAINSSNLKLTVYTRNGNVNISAPVTAKEVQLTTGSNGGAAVGDVSMTNTNNNISQLYGSIKGDLSVKSAASTLTLGGGLNETLDVQGKLDVQATSGAMDVVRRVRANGSLLKLNASGDITVGSGINTGMVQGDSAVNIEAGGTITVNGTPLTSGIRGNVVNVKADTVKLKGGSTANGKAYIRGDQFLQVQATSGSVILEGGAGENATAVIGSERGGKVKVEAKREIFLTGGSGNNAFAGIGSFINTAEGAPLGVGAVELSAPSLTLASNGADALIVTQNNQLSVSGGMSLPATIYTGIHPDDLTKNGFPQLGWLQIGSSSGSSSTISRLAEIRATLRDQFLAILDDRQKQKREQAKDDIRVEGSDAECR